MRPERKPKKHFYIIRDGRKVGESWAVSPKKAIANYWWKSVKKESALSSRNYEPTDFDAVEV